MNADDIARFLRTHPQFFDQHPELLEIISVTHPYGGRANPISISLWRLLRSPPVLPRGLTGRSPTAPATG
jgi:uncharacterized protein YigA (DUF484 family)